MRMADRHARDGASGAGALSSASLYQWSHVPNSGPTHAPPPRSGHAMTLITATDSVLVFGGSNGEEFFDDFHVLEPTQYAVVDPKRKPARTRSSRSTIPPAQSQSATPTPMNNAATPASPLSLVWKKLVVSRAPSTSLYNDPSFLASSFAGSSADSSDSPRDRRVAANDDMDQHLGGGRDYHTMHYVTSTTAGDEKRSGFRVLVLGNTVVSIPDHANGRGGSSQVVHTYDQEDMRLDEVRIKQPLLEAQWVPRKIKSMYKPHARNGHCSALFGEQLFCFGGKNATLTAFYDDFFYFDVALHQWCAPPTTGSAPSARAFASMAVSSSTEQLFLYGGNDDKQQFGGMYMFDIRHSRWDKVSARGDKPATRINHTLTFVAPHHLVVFGGRQRTSRRNDVFQYDLQTRVWSKLGPKLSSTAEDDASQCGDGSSSSSSQWRPIQSQSQWTATATATQLVGVGGEGSAGHAMSKAAPKGRTAHSTVLYQQRMSSATASDRQQLIVFGGYAGSHTWLNDVHVLELLDASKTTTNQEEEKEEEKEEQPVAFVRYTAQVFSTTSSTASSREITTTTRGPSRASNASRSSSSSSHSHSHSSTRPSSSSRSSVESVLADITNITPPATTTTSSSTATTASSSTSSAITTTTTAAAPPAAPSTMPSGGYTPAAVAARRRRLAELESARAERSPLSQQQKKRKRTGSAEGTTTASQSQSHSQSQSQSRSQKGNDRENECVALVAGKTLALSPLPSSSPSCREDTVCSSLSSDSQAIGIQTTLIQVLQHQQRMEQSLARLTAAVRKDAGGSRQYDALAAHQVFLIKQNDQLESKLDVMTRRLETEQGKVQSLEDDKRVLQCQLRTAETENYMYKKTVDDLVPRLSAQVLSAVEQAARAQSNCTQLVEAKISAIHDVLEDIRHASGERTETDESPQKRDSIFPDDCSPSQPRAPTVLYPQSVVRDLEHKLHDAVQQNHALHERITRLEARLRKAEGNAQRIQELSMAWLRNQHSQDDDDHGHGHDDGEEGKAAAVGC